jgi:hypothetical protein
MFRFVCVAALLIAVVALAAGCTGDSSDNGDSDGGTPTSPTPTPTDTPVTPTDTPTVTNTPTSTPTPTALPIQPLNGEELESNGASGLGELTIDNGTSTDAMVRVADFRSGASVRLVYVVRQSSWVITDLPPGTYKLLFALGLDLDPVTMRFQRQQSFTAFEDPFDFTEVEDAEGTTYDAWEVTLHPVVGGDADTEEIDEADFYAE